MLDPTYVREHLPAVRDALRRRGMNPDGALDQLATILSDRRRIIPEFEELKRQQNASGEEIGPQDLFLGPSAQGPALIERMTLDDAERHLIQRALARCGGNVSEAARMLGVSRVTIYKWKARIPDSQPVTSNR